MIILLILPAAAGQDWLRNEEYDVSLDINSEFSIVAEDKDYRVDYVSVMLSFVPRDTAQQTVLKLDTEPEAERIGHDYEFKWLDPEEGDYSFGLEAEVKTKNYIKKVTGKVYFPVSVGEEYQKWLNISKNIDSDNAAIIQKAADIAEGNDLYEVVYKLARWVNEKIEYDPACGDDFEKASWVLYNQRGTCDEYTSLFVAMCRALGIPARYISGIAYSNIPEIEGFGAHAWAEVYFPDYGWIPFDATYGQFGFVDASHIILKEGADPGESSTSYEWKGLHANLEARELQIDAFKIKESGIAEHYISIDAEPAEIEVGFGSYNIIEVNIENLKNYYVSNEIYIAKPAEIELIEGFDKTVLLKPNEKKTIYWIVKVPEGLRENIIYTFPIKISSLGNADAETEFSSSISDEIYSKTEIEENIKIEVVEEEEEIIDEEEVVEETKVIKKEIEEKEEITTPQKTSFWQKIINWFKSLFEK